MDTTEAIDLWMSIYDSPNRYQDYDEGWELGNTWISLYATIDLDYRIAYLLRVSGRRGDGSTVMVAVYAGYGKAFKTQQMKGPNRFSDWTMQAVKAAHLEFAEWAFRMDEDFHRGG